MRTSEDLKIGAPVESTKPGEDDTLAFFGRECAQLDITDKLPAHGGLLRNTQQIVRHTHRVEADDWRGV